MSLETKVVLSFPDGTGSENMQRVAFTSLTGVPQTGDVFAYPDSDQRFVVTGRRWIAKQHETLLVIDMASHPG